MSPGYIISWTFFFLNIYNNLYIFLKCCFQNYLLNHSVFNRKKPTILSRIWHPSLRFSLLYKCILWFWGSRILFSMKIYLRLLDDTKRQLHVAYISPETATPWAALFPAASISEKVAVFYLCRSPMGDTDIYHLRSETVELSQ